MSSSHPGLTNFSPRENQRMKHLPSKGNSVVKRKAEKLHLSSAKSNFKGIDVCSSRTMSYSGTPSCSQGSCRGNTGFKNINPRFMIQVNSMDVGNLSFSKKKIPSSPKGKKETSIHLTPFITS